MPRPPTERGSRVFLVYGDPGLDKTVPRLSQIFRCVYTTLTFCSNSTILFNHKPHFNNQLFLLFALLSETGPATNLPYPH